ncbi:pantoate--beta-alanine ligase [Clostridium frigidicarnis]|uniref:Pantothenate synthetase n=1 Tax=Clostridium frigidicarnis TaxID=84698 RepID=A0A1I0ZAN5_9CLOT|nr:pantoate--beta-alanine ligase [Clostridium frigidicarnis]SFB22819.1 pantoate--beta-alanine ligase [Clostridium frigidicarnis]
MKLLKSIEEVREYILNCKNKNFSIGLVPTMGYLHEGHGSLIKQARKNNDKVVVSIFVNPIQFGPTEDLSTYPRDLEKDSLFCESLGVDVIFAPSSKKMYPSNSISTFVTVNNITEVLCGAKRPGHFQGVCTVVSKLFNIISPTRAYFGEKDYQQLTVIKTMVKELNFPVEIIGCPIVREDDLLAKSSRNSYLSNTERQDALVLYKSLLKCKDLISTGEFITANIKKEMEAIIHSVSSSKIDYIDIVDTNNLMPVELINHDVLVALAVYIGETRLIDNMTFKIKEA